MIQKKKLKRDLLKVFILLLVAALPFGISSAWAAGSFKMGVVDPQLVLERSKAGKRSLASLKEYTTARQKIIAGDERELKRLEEDLKSSSAGMTEKEKREKQGQFRVKLQAYQKRVQEFNQELAGKQKELVDEYMKKISVATKAIAERRGLSLVVDKGSENTMKIVIFNRKSLDITDQVVKEFNRRFK